ncbi:hypothetical protein COO60DRAFT_1645123 [Scenedesmus sp. NREL 46B-D3]|nr:hypothetical protein COO60DRAFT_1645123 [Scenedesmus sp. NREL 46B-D3]
MSETCAQAADDYSIAIPSYDRANSLQRRTLASLVEAGVDCQRRVHIFVAGKDERERYARALPRGTFADIVVGKLGIGKQRSHIMSHFGQGANVGGGSNWPGMQVGRTLHAPSSTNWMFIQGPFMGFRVWQDLQLNPAHDDILEDVQYSLMHCHNDGKVLRINGIGLKASPYGKEPGGMQSVLVASAKQARMSDNREYLMRQYGQYVLNFASWLPKHAAVVRSITIEEPYLEPRVVIDGLPGELHLEAAQQLLQQAMQLAAALAAAAAAPVAAAVAAAAGQDTVAAVPAAQQQREQQQQQPARLPPLGWIMQRRLHIHALGQHYSCLAGLAQLSQLTSLKVTGFWDGSELPLQQLFAHLLPLRMLHLDIYHAKLPLLDLSRASQLEEFRQQWQAVINGVAAATNLTRLGLEAACRFDNDGEGEGADGVWAVPCARLAGLTNLKALRIRLWPSPECVVPGDALALTALTGLASLKLMDVGAGNAGLTQQGLMLLTGLKRLRQLRVKYNDQVTDGVVKRFWAVVRGQ